MNPVEPPPISVESANTVLAEMFAPWVQALNLRIESIEEQEVRMRMPYSDDLCRAQQIVCGQALMALVDTCMVFVCFASQGRYGNCTTVSQNTSFMRAVVGQDVIATGTLMKPGRQLVFGEITLRTAQDNKIVGQGTSTCMLLPD